MRRISLAVLLALVLLGSAARLRAAPLAVPIPVVVSGTCTNVAMAGDGDNYTNATCSSTDLLMLCATGVVEWSRIDYLAAFSTSEANINFRLFDQNAYVRTLVGTAPGVLQKWREVANLGLGNCVDLKVQTGTLKIYEIKAFTGAGEGRLGIPGSWTSDALDIEMKALFQGFYGQMVSALLAIFLAGWGLWSLRKSLAIVMGWSPSFGDKSIKVTKKRESSDLD